MGRIIERSTLAQARVLFVAGASSSTVSESLGISWVTARKLSARFQPVQCTCGKKANHKARCRPRLEHKVSSNNIVNQVAFELLSTNSYIISDGSIGKCVEAACPFPAVCESRCRQHATDFKLGYSFLSSTLAPLDLFLFPNRTRVGKRYTCK